MSRTREIVRSIHSISATKQITSAMKMVAAAKLGKTQQQVTPLQAYADQLETMLQRVMAFAPHAIVSPYCKQRPNEQVLLVVISSDRGLCGSLNTKVFKKALQYLQETRASSSPHGVTIMPIGSKALDFFSKKQFKLIKKHVMLSQHLSFKHVGRVAQELIEAFLEQTYDQIVLVHHIPQNIATQVPTAAPWLPITLPNSSEDHTATTPYIYEPSQGQLLATLLPHVLQVRYYQALLAANAAEHGARMTAMNKATDNAEELLKDLQITYNRTRQAAITQEISEIVAGTKG